MEITVSVKLSTLQRLYSKEDEIDGFYKNVDYHLRLLKEIHKSGKIPEHLGSYLKGVDSGKRFESVSPEHYVLNRLRSE